MSKKLTCFLAAGGTGGHLFPAQALAEVLTARGHRVHLMTDDRAERYGVTFPAETIHVIRSATMTKRTPIAVAKTLNRLGQGVFQSLRILKKYKPDIIVGFGGYPTVPPLYGASLASIPLMLHEQNAVAGRANRMLAKKARSIATSFEITKGFEKAINADIRCTGNPVRLPILEGARQAYAPAMAGKAFKLLVFGGSQGARFFSDVVPQAIAFLPDNLRKRLEITQQCRAEDLMRVRDAYEDWGVSADLGSFFADLAQRMCDAHLIIARSGATTIAELSVMGRPSLLVPFPHSLDHDQAMNARILQQKEGAFVIDQDELSPLMLAEQLRKMMQSPDQLSQMAHNARQVGRPAAVIDLADMVEQSVQKR